MQAREQWWPLRGTRGNHPQPPSDRSSRPYLGFCNLGPQRCSDLKVRSGGGGCGYRTWPADKPSLPCIVPRLEDHTPEKAIKVLDSPASVPPNSGALRGARSHGDDGRVAPWPHWGDLKKQIRARGRWSARSKAVRVSLAALHFEEERWGPPELGPPAPRLGSLLH